VAGGTKNLQEISRLRTLISLPLVLTSALTGAGIYHLVDRSSHGQAILPLNTPREVTKTSLQYKTKPDGTKYATSCSTTFTYPIRMQALNAMENNIEKMRRDLKRMGTEEASEGKIEQKTDGVSSSFPVSTTLEDLDAYRSNLDLMRAKVEGK